MAQYKSDHFVLNHHEMLSASITVQPCPVNVPLFNSAPPHILTIHGRLVHESLTSNLSSLTVVLRAFGKQEDVTITRQSVLARVFLYHAGSLFVCLPFSFLSSLPKLEEQIFSKQPNGHSPSPTAKCLHMELTWCADCHKSLNNLSGNRCMLYIHTYVS